MPESLPQKPPKSPLFPFAFGTLTDPEFPARVHVRAVTPYIPLDLSASSLPLVEISIGVENTSCTPLPFTVAGTTTYIPELFADPLNRRITPPVAEPFVNGGWTGVMLAGEAVDSRRPSIAIAVDDERAEQLPEWSVDFWPDAAEEFWTAFTATGELPHWESGTHESVPLPLFSQHYDDRSRTIWDALPKARTTSVASTRVVDAGRTVEFSFILAWLVPHRRAAWNGNIGLESGDRERRVLNFYAARWQSARDVVAHFADHTDDLIGRSVDFARTLYETSIPLASVRSIATSLATTRTPLLFVIGSGDGSRPVLAAWEGLLDDAGSCEGTCTHVWSYAQTLAWVFPELERSAREIEFDEETDRDGAQRFRSNAAFGNPMWFMAPAVDGQLGTVIRLYREWRFCADDSWLSDRWPLAARTLDFALDRWVDPRTGLIDARVHNTYDIEFEGSEPLGNSMLIAALDAGARLAERMGDSERVRRWRTARLQCRAAFTTRLFNGTHFQQIGESNTARHQYGSGVLADQLIGQFHAAVNGLEPVADRENLESAIKSIFAYNFVEDLSSIASTRRGFALGGEAGLVLATWPHGGRPRIPFVYSDEVWTGIEHEIAALLLWIGRITESDAVEQAVFERYDGSKRNPWSEIECGRSYARSLSAWSLLLVESGQQWDAPERRLAFRPARPEGYSGLFIIDGAWGHALIRDEEISLTVLDGAIEGVALTCDGIEVHADLSIECGRTVRFTR